jgi:hypothetical protein
MMETTRAKMQRTVEGTNGASVIPARHFDKRRVRRTLLSEEAVQYTDKEEEQEE